MHLRHCADQASAVGRGKGLQQGGGGPFGTHVHLAELAPAGGREPGRSHPPIRRCPGRSDEALRLEGLDQPGDVGRIETEPPAEVPEIGAVGADLEEQPRLAERAVAPQKVIVQRPDALGDEAVEPADLGNLIAAILDFSHE